MTAAPPAPPIVPATVRWQCADCKTPRSKPEKRMPTGWKRQAETVYCPACWRQRYLLRAITIPVAAPEGSTWDELRASIRAMWGATTQASNWIMTELYARDVKRGGQKKLPPMKPIYLYPEIRERFPGLPSQSCAALEKAVTAKYRAKRYEVIWTCAASLPTHRYPTPFPVPNQGWSVAMDGNHPLVSLRVGDSRIALRLRGGARFHRQLSAVRRIASGEAEPGQMDIYAQGKDIMCKMVAWLPRETAAPAKAPAGNILAVRSSADSLLIAVNLADERLWIYNGDQLRRWSAEHRKQLQRWAEDAKAEHRPIPPFAERRREAAVRYRRRTASACHQVASMLVGYAVRRRFAGIRYDDSVRDFCADFAWAQMARLIAEKCDAAGITFEAAAGGPAAEETGEALAKA